MHDEEYTIADIVEIESLTKSVCLRPRLHTVSGSLEEVYSFINALACVRQGAETVVAKAAIAWFIRHAELREAKLNFDSLRKTYGSDADVLLVLLRELNANAHN